MTATTVERPARSRRVRTGTANVRITPTDGGYEVRIGSGQRARRVGTIARRKGAWQWRAYSVTPVTADPAGLPTDRLARRGRKVDGDLNTAAYATLGAYLGWGEIVTDVTGLTWRHAADGFGPVGVARGKEMVWSRLWVTADAAETLAGLLDVPLHMPASTP